MDLTETSISRELAIKRANTLFESGQFFATLDRMVRYKTKSQSSAYSEELISYLEIELIPAFAALGFETQIVQSPTGKGPTLLATRVESEERPTVLMYGHGDVVGGMIDEWSNGIDPWRCTTRPVWRRRVPQVADTGALKSNACSCLLSRSRSSASVREAGGSVEQAAAWRQHSLSISQTIRLGRMVPRSGCSKR